MSTVSEQDPPVITPPLPRRRIATISVLVALTALIGCALLLLLLPHHSGKSVRLDLPADVTVEVRELETNADSVVSALVIVRNESEAMLEFGYGVQIRAAEGWAHTNGNPDQFLLRTDNDPLLPPHSERLVAVRQPRTGDPWRVVAMCWTPARDSEPRGKTIRFFSPEQEP